MDRLETAVRSIRLLTNQIEEHLAWFRAHREELTEEAKLDINGYANSIQSEAEKLAIATAPDDPTGF